MRSSLLFIVKYTLFEAYRRKLGLLYLFLVILCSAIGSYAKAISILETSEAFIGFYSTSIRILSIFILSIYLIITESRAFSKANIQILLSLPISRTDLMIGKILGYSIVAALLVILVMLPLMIFEPHSLSIWGLSFFCELLIVIVITLMLVIVFEHPVFSISIFSLFYIFSRSATEFYLHANYLIMAKTSTAIDQVLAWPVKTITFIVPKLDQYANSTWLMYGSNEQSLIVNIIVQTVLYLALITLIVIYEFRRKTF